MKRFVVIAIGWLICLGGTLPAQEAWLGPAPRAESLSDVANAAERHHLLPRASGASWYDTTDRETIRSAYNSVWLPSRTTTNIAWTGQISSCMEGTTSQAWKDNVASGLNFLRNLSGIQGTVTINATYSAKAQKAALMMRANGQLSHTPPTAWTCYSTDGAQAASNSNLCLDPNLTPGCLDPYMDDFGSGNTATGHRRWILYPWTQAFGTGDVPGGGSVYGGNALWVFDTFSGARPTTREAFVAWPSPGYFPYPLLPERWSFSYPSADFSSATVTLSKDGAAVPVSLETVANGYGENAVVFYRTGANTGSPTPHPVLTADVAYDVSIKNAVLNGEALDFSYRVTAFDPAVVVKKTPSVNTGGITPLYSSSTTIQPGAWASIFGENLSGSTAVWNGDFPTSLGNVSVSVNGKSAYLWFVSPGQINFQAPDDTARGSVSVVVKNANGSVTTAVTLGSASPSFSLLGDGKHLAAVILTPDGKGAYGDGAYDLAGPAGAFSYNTRPVRPGETVSLFGVGFGATSPAVAAGRIFNGAAPTDYPVSITIGGVSAAVSFSGITAAGLYQFNLVAPAAGAGDKAVVAITGGLQTPAGPVLTMQ